MTKFRDMTDSEKLEIINAMISGEYVETTCNRGDLWQATGGVKFDKCYRIPKRQMSIDWSVLKDEFICAAIDGHGYPCAFTCEPIKYGGVWRVENGSRCINISGLKSYDPGTVDWTESLIWKPGFEPK